MDAAVHPVEIPRRAVAEIVVELERLILGQHADGLDAGIDAVGQREVDDAVFAAVGNGRLCDVFGEDAEPAALSAGEQHGKAFCFLRADEHRRLNGVDQRPQLGDIKLPATIVVVFFSAIHG